MDDVKIGRAIEKIIKKVTPILLSIAGLLVLLWILGFI